MASVYSDTPEVEKVHLFNLFYTNVTVYSFILNLYKIFHNDGTTIGKGAFHKSVHQLYFLLPNE